MSSAPNRHEMELVASAAGAERSNRPRWMIVGASVLLTAAMIYAFVSIGSLARARASLSDVEAELAVVQRRVDAYRSAAGEMAGRASIEDPQTVKKLEDLGDLVGLNVRVNENLKDYDQRGFRRRELDATLQDADPSLFLSWVHAVMQSEDLSGIQVNNLSMTPPRHLRPGAEAGWNVSVVFHRLERRP